MGEPDHCWANEYELSSCGQERGYFEEHEYSWLCSCSHTLGKKILPKDSETPTISEVR